MSCKPSLSKSFSPSVHRASNVPAALLGGGASFNPASISGLRSRLLDANTFTSPIDSKYYLKDSSTTNTHLPRQGRAWLFDGSNDYGVIPAGVNSTWGSSFSVSFWTYFTGTNSHVLSVNNGINVMINILSGSILFGNTTGFNIHGATFSNIWIHWVCVYDSSLSGMSRWIIYKNGALATVGPNGSLLAPTSSSGLIGIRNVGLAQPYGGSLRDIRIYSSAKDSTAVSAIYNQSLTGNGTFDETNLVACYPCNEESGTTGYDISGNGNHLTLTNITQATFHAANTGVLANRNNAEGYRLSGSVYIPKRLTDSLAADGNALTVTGRAAYHGCVETPCVTGDGSSVRVELGQQLPTTGDFSCQLWYYHAANVATRKWIVEQWTGASSGRLGVYANASNGAASSGSVDLQVDTSLTTAVALTANTWHLITISRATNTFACTVTPLGGSTVSLPTISYAGSLTATSTNLFNDTSTSLPNDGRIADFSVTTGGVTTYFPLQDGPGSSSTNRNIAWVKSDGTGGIISNAIVNGTVSTIWGNRVPGNVEDWCIKYGGRIAANGAFVAGMLTGGNAADGSAKTLTAGKFGNPFSRLNLNPATAAELNGRSVQTAYEDLPCVTGNGANVYLNPALTLPIGNFSLSFWYYNTSGITTHRILDARVGSNLFILVVNNGVPGQASFYGKELVPGFANGAFQNNTWHSVVVTQTGTSISCEITPVGGSTSTITRTVLTDDLSASPLYFMGAYNNSGSPTIANPSPGRIAGITLTTGGVTTYFPLSDGSGADLAWFKSDGTKGVVPTALQGTLTNVWANKTDGSKVAATKYALRAIVTRETEFNRVASDGDDRFLIYDNALSGADLTNIEGYLV